MIKFNCRLRQVLRYSYLDTVDLICFEIPCIDHSVIRPTVDPSSVRKEHNILFFFKFRKNKMHENGNRTAGITAVYVFIGIPVAKIQLNQSVHPKRAKHTSITNTPLTVRFLSFQKFFTNKRNEFWRMITS